MTYPENRRRPTRTTAETLPVRRQDLGPIVDACKALSARTEALTEAVAALMVTVRKIALKVGVTP